MADPELPSFGGWIRRQRKARDLTQARFAAAVGCALGTVRRIEADDLRPSRELAACLLHALGIPSADHAALVQWARGGAAPAAATPPARVFTLRHMMVPATPLVGRESLIADLHARLRDPAVRALTLTGPPGIGKTRLALHIAATCPALIAPSVVVVPLAPLSAPEQVIIALAQALGVQQTGSVPLEEELCAALRDQRLLLVVDNLEPVIDEAARIVALLLAAVPGLRVLATSRIPLRISSEHQVPVPPLALPDVSAALPTLAAAPAVTLLVARVQAVWPAFQLTPTNAAAVAMLCQRLDGLPLALELVAPQLKIIPLATLLDRLDAGTTEDVLLAPLPRDLPARHQSLFRALDGSYQLLPPLAQRLFRILGLWMGSATQPAIAAVWNALGSSAPPLEPLLAHLVESSLLHREDGVDPATVRFGMLATIRDYAGIRLTETAEAAVASRAYASYYHDVVLAAEAALEGPEQPATLDRLAAEQPQIRSVLRWAVTMGDARMAWEMAGALWRFWWLRGLWAEGRSWCTAVLAIPVPDPLDPATSIARLNAMNGAGVLAGFQGEYAAARALHTGVLDAARSLGHQRQMARSLSHLAFLADMEGDYTLAEQLYRESLVLVTILDDARLRKSLIGNLGMLCHMQGKLAQAADYYGESLMLNQQQGGTPSSQARIQTNLGLVLLAQGAVDAAEQLFLESAALYAQLDSPSTRAVADHTLGMIAHYRGNHPQAHQRYAQSLAAAQACGDQSGCIDTLLMQALLAQEHGDTVAASQAQTEALTWAERIDYQQGVARALYLEGLAALQGGHLVQAAAWFRRSLTQDAHAGHVLGLLDTLDAITIWAIAVEQTVEAATLAGAVARMRSLTGARRWPATDRHLYGPALVVGQRHVPATAWIQAWETGQAWEQEDALELARHLLRRYAADAGNALEQPGEQCRAWL